MTSLADGLDGGRRARGHAVRRARSLGLLVNEDTPVADAVRLLGTEDWKLERDIDALSIAFPTVLELTITDPFDNFFSADTQKIGVLWDGSRRAAGPITVIEGSVVQIPLSQRLGERLVFFATADVIGDVRALSPSEAAQSVEKRVAEEGRSVFSETLDKFIGLEKEVLTTVEALAGVLIVGGLVYLAIELKRL